MSILNPIFEAVAWVMMRIVAVLSVPFGATTGLTWGLSIVILVVLMRLLMVPLFIKQRNSMQKMQSHMPQLQEIRKRYKNDKQRLNEETMKFYKENGINPLGGCLPMLAQLPLFWALFNVLEAIAQWTHGTPKYGLSTAVVQNARQAHVFGVTLADSFLRPIQGETWGSRIIILIFVLVSAGTTFLTMWQSKRRGMLNQATPDPDQPGAAAAAAMSKNMMYIAPFFALTGLYWQFGLVIYWVTTNLWTLGQQHFLFRKLPVVESATVGSSAAQATQGSTRVAAKNAPSGTSAKTSAKAPESKTAAPAKPASKSGTSSSAAAKAPAAKPKANGVAAANGTSDSSGLLKRFAKKEEPQEVPAAPEAKTVRHQPSRQSRSRRNTGKR
ncbi:MAG TPA: membrane protein insertase YidC [Trebonia sp.]|nr:membrane protein insertase YidC [Trebonia sp.]